MNLFGTAKNRRFWVLTIFAAVFTSLLVAQFILSRRPPAHPDLSTIGAKVTVQNGIAVVVKVLEKDSSGGTTPAFAAGMKKGDRIMSLSPVGGAKKILKGDLDFLGAVRSLQFGSPFTVYVERAEGTAAPVEIALEVPPLPRPHETEEISIPSLAIVYGFPLVCVITGLCIGLMRLEDANAFTAALLFFCFGRFKADIQVFPEGVWQLAMLMASLQFSAWSYLFMRFFFTFPSPSPIDRRYPWLKKALVSFPIAFTLWNFMWSFVPLVSFSADAAKVHYLRWFDLILDGVFIALFAAGFLSLALNLATMRDLDDRRRLRILLVGSLGVLPTLYFYVERVVLDRSHILPYWMFLLQWVALALFPLAFAYVVVKHRVFGIRVILRRGLQYALLSRGFLFIEGVALFLVLFYAAGPILGRLLEGTSPSTLAIGMALLTMLGTLGLRRLNTIVMHALDRRFFRETYDGKRILTELGRDVERLATEPYTLARTVVEKITDSLHPNVVALFLRGTDIAKLPHLGEAAKRLPGKAILSQSPDFYCFWKVVREPAGAAQGRAGGGCSTDALPPSYLVVRQLEGMEEQEPYALEVYLDDPKSWAAEILDEAPFSKERAEEQALLQKYHTRLVVPLLAHKRVVGFLSLGEKRSEEPYSKEDRELLVSVAQQVAVALVYAGFIREEAEQLNLRHDIEVAQKVQERLLPQKKPVVKGLDYLGACRPAFGVGGDCYDFVDLGREKVGFALGDVSGKGVSAALLMASVQAMLRIHADTHGQEVHLLARDINKHLCSLTDMERFVTFFYGVYDGVAGTLAYVNAGHNPPMLIRPRGGMSVGARALRERTFTGEDGLVEKLMPTGMVMGVVPEVKYEKETVSLLPGDLLVVYTDGITEAMNGAGEEYGEDRLEALLRSRAHLSPEEIRAAVFEDVRAFLGDSPQNDDITLVLAKVR